MNVREIIEDYLKDSGYGGLVNTEIPCGCVIGDLLPCGEECMNLEECDAGYIHYCDDCPNEIREECDVDGCPCAGGYCVGPEKEMKVREPDPPPEPWITEAKLQDTVEFYYGDVRNEEKMTGVVKIIDSDHLGLRVFVEGRGNLVEVDRVQFIRIVGADGMSDANAPADFVAVKKGMSREEYDGLYLSHWPVPKEEK